MEKDISLGDLQQLTMLAVLRLGDEAYGARIRQELEEVARRSVSISTVYVTLVRLENQGLARSTRSAPEPARGGKAKRFFSLTPAGKAALHASRAATDRMWDGLEPGVT